MTIMTHLPPDVVDIHVHAPTGPSPHHPRAHREQDERDHDGEAHQTADLEWPVTAHAAPSRRRFGALRFRIVSSDSRSSENSFPCRTRHAEQQTDRCTGRQTFHGFPLLNSASQGGLTLADMWE